MYLIHLKNTLKFLFQYTLAGLAVAFILLLLFPDRLLHLYEPPQNNIAITDKNPAEISSYSSAIALTSPAVVNVYATQVLSRQINPLFQDPVFQRFFGEQAPDQQIRNNLGSGVILNQSGYVLTNAHVVQEALDIQITLTDGRQVKADVIGVDTETDLAVLHIQLDQLPVALIGNSESLKVGDVVLAIGNPYNFGQTVTQGIVSATRRSRVGVSLIEDFIQTDAAINPGNSGGALINSRGELVGINTANYSATGGSQGIGFAIPIDLAIKVMKQLIHHGFVERGWLGIVPQPIPVDIASSLNLESAGVFVTAVFNDSPAARAGVMPGDIITKINGTPLQDAQQAVQKISSLMPGEMINLDILRGWDELFLTTEVVQRPKMQP
jgi:serine protease DegS